MCVCAEANKAAVAAKGGIEAVVAAMRRHEGVAGVAERGCGALNNIAMLGGWSAAVRARAAGGAGRGSGSGSGSAGSQCARRGDVRARGCVCSVQTRGGWSMHGRGRVRACVRVGAQPWCSRGVCVCVCVCALMLVRTSFASLVTSLAPMCCAHLTYWDTMH